MRFAIAAFIILPFGLWRLYRRPVNLSELANAAGWARAAEFRTTIISDV
jgi:hypothetical protein